MHTLIWTHIHIHFYLLYTHSWCTLTPAVHVLLDPFITVTVLAECFDHSRNYCPSATTVLDNMPLLIILFSAPLSLLTSHCEWCLQEAASCWKRSKVVPGFHYKEQEVTHFMPQFPYLKLWESLMVVKKNCAQNKREKESPSRLSWTSSSLW